MTDLRTREAARRYATDSGLRDGVKAGLVSWDLVRLRAYLGDEEARGLVGSIHDGPQRVVRCASYSPGSAHACSWEHNDQHPLVDWLGGLKRLASKFPPYRVEVECETGCKGEISDCIVCPGTGRVTHDTPAERYLLVAAAHGVAREVLKAGKGFAPGEGDPSAARAESALDACAHWLKCPCPTCLYDWQHHTLSAAMGHGPQWLPRPDQVDAGRTIQAAAKILGPDTRDHAARSVLAALTDPKPTLTPEATP